MIDEAEGRANALLRSLIAAALVAAAHVGGFVWLASRQLSPQPPDAVRGLPIDIDLLAAAPPEPPHSAAPPAPPATPPSAEPPPPTPEPAPPTPPPSPPPPTKLDPPPPSPQPPPPTPEPAPPSPPPSPDPPPPSPPPTPAVPPNPEPSPTKPAPTLAPTVPPDLVIAPAPPPKPKPRPAPRPTADPQKLERERARAEARRSQRDAVADRASKDAPRPASNGERQGGAPQRASSGADLATWRGEVLARISEFKPPSSGATGTAVVAFTVDGGGRVISASLVRSSGNSGLDTASVAMVRRASPVPAPPPELGARVNVTVPVRYQ